MLEDVDELARPARGAGRAGQRPCGRRGQGTRRRLGDLARTVAGARAAHRPRLSWSATTTLVVDGRPRQMERAVSNLIDNAVKYSGTDDHRIDVEI